MTATRNMKYDVVLGNFGKEYEDDTHDRLLGWKVVEKRLPYKAALERVIQLTAQGGIKPGQRYFANPTDKRNYY
jgi:hypothetical protein